MREETGVLEKAIASSGSDLPTRPENAPKRDHFGLAGPDSPIGWAALGTLVAEMENGPGSGSFGILIKLHNRLTKFSVADFENAFDEIAGLDIPEQNRKALEDMLLEMYVTKAPRQALERFSDRLRDDESEVSGWLTKAFGEWVEEDPAAALSWMDRSIEGGVFDSKTLEGRNQNRAIFEGRLIGWLLKANPGAALARALDLPLQERKQMLGSAPIGADEYAAYASLTRSSFDNPEDVLKTMSMVAGNLAKMDDFSSVDRFIENGKLSQDEIDRVVGMGAFVSVASTYNKPVTKERIEKLGAWVAGKTPANEAKLIGRALAQAASHPGNSFADMATIARTYHEGGNNDEVIAAFLTNYLKNSRNASNREGMEKLLQSISDTALRAEVREGIK